MMEFSELKYFLFVKRYVDSFSLHYFIKLHILNVLGKKVKRSKLHWENDFHSNQGNINIEIPKIVFK